MKSNAESVLIDVLIEVGCLLVAYLISHYYGMLTFETTTYNEFITKLFISGFPVWGLILIIPNNSWRRRTAWLSAFLFLISPYAGSLLFISRLLGLHSLTVRASRWLGVILLMFECLNPFCLTAFFLFGPAHMDESRTKVGRNFVNQYRQEYSLRTKPTVVLEKQIPLFGKLFMTSYLFEVPNQFELLDLKVIDTKTIEIEFDGKPLQIDVN